MKFFVTLQPASRANISRELTEREREILSFIADGQTNAEIAEKLVINMKTVRYLVSNVFRKLQVVDRAQAAIERAKRDWVVLQGRLLQEIMDSHCLSSGFARLRFDSLVPSSLSS